MISMSTIPSIRRRCDDGDSVARIAGEEEIFEPTVRKCRDTDDFFSRVRVPKRRASKLDPFKPGIDFWFAKGMRRRPRCSRTLRPTRWGGALRGRAEPGAVRRHRLRAHAPGQVLPRRRDGRMVEEDCQLVDVAAHDCGAGSRRA